MLLLVSILSAVTLHATAEVIDENNSSWTISKT